MDCDVIPIVMVGTSQGAYASAPGNLALPALPLSFVQSTATDTATGQAITVVLAPPIVICPPHLRFRVGEHLRLAGITGARVMLMPVDFSTGLAVAVAALDLTESRPDILLWVIDADIAPANTVACMGGLMAAIPAALSGKLVAFGRQSVATHTDQLLTRTGVDLTSAVGSRDFVKSADAGSVAGAAAIIPAGRYLRSAGVFLMTARTLIDELAMLAPAVLSTARAAVDTGVADADFLHFAPQIFESCPAISLEHALAVVSSRTLVVPARVGSDDVDKWRADNLVGSTDTRYGPMVFFKHDSGAVTQSLIQYGEWAENELAFLRRVIPRGSVVVDVGAYIGTHALAFARQVGDGGLVYAIEAQPASFALLTENIQTNQADNVVLVNAIAAARVGTFSLLGINISGDASFGSMSVENAVRPPDSSATVATNIADGSGGISLVPTITLDSIPLTSCALIKIDAEGMEDLVLEGASNVIGSFRPVIYAECNCVEKGSAVFERLRQCGYRIFMHLAGAYNNQNWNGSTTDIFGVAKEAALVGVPPERLRPLLDSMVGSYEIFFEITTLDDLVAGMLIKPQYPHEVLQHTSATRSTGTGFWHVVAEATDESRRCREAAEAAKDEVARLLQCVAQASAETTEAQEQARYANAEAVRAGGEIERLTAQISSTYASTSWRLTGPLRFVGRRFRHER